MKRCFLVLVVFSMVLFFTGCGEDNNKIKTVAFISLSNVDNNTFNGFKSKMKEMGWNENENIKYVVAGAALNVKNLPNKVSSIIKQKPDMILVSSTPATQEVKKQNIDIPVVFCPVNDPVGAKIVQNTNKPEGMITGVRLPVGDHKRTEWLYQIVPNIKNVLVPYTLKYQSSIKSLKDMEEIAKELGFSIISKPFDNVSGIDQFLKSLPKNIDAIMLPRDSIIESHIDKFVAYTLKRKIPLSAPSYQQVEKGALYTYGFIHTELGKDAAGIADKILKGVKVTDLPVKFGNAYLVLNKTTAKKIGIILNDDMLSKAKLVLN
jgi:putative tryptophan/tyrosine transport system substrate-binding protein